MKTATRQLLILVVFVAVAAALILAYAALRAERDREADADAPVAAPSRVEPGEGDAPRVRLDAATQERLGLRTLRPAAGELERVVSATARVLDAGALAISLNEVRAAQAALEAARRDHDRKRKLYENGQIASGAAVEAADALVRQGQLAVDAARDRLAAGWGEAIARRDDLDAFAGRLLARQAALVQVELLATEPLAAPPAVVRLCRQGGEAVGTAQVLGPALSISSAVVGQAFLGVATNSRAPLVPGAVLVAQLDTGTRDRGVVIPGTRSCGMPGAGGSTSRPAPTRLPGATCRWTDLIRRAGWRRASGRRRWWLAGRRRCFRRN